MKIDRTNNETLVLYIFKLVTHVTESVLSVLKKNGRKKRLEQKQQLGNGIKFR